MNARTHAWSLACRSNARLPRRVIVHMRCYGVRAHPNGSSWLCDVCRLPGLSQPPACALCPRVGGAMKMTAEGGWCHLLCATWVPGCAVADPER